MASSRAGPQPARLEFSWTLRGSGETGQRSGFSSSFHNPQSTRIDLPAELVRSVDQASVQPAAGDGFCFRAVGSGEGAGNWPGRRSVAGFRTGRTKTRRAPHCQAGLSSSTAGRCTLAANRSPTTFTSRACSFPLS